MTIRLFNDLLPDAKWRDSILAARLTPVFQESISLLGSDGIQDPTKEEAFLSKLLKNT